MLYEVITFKGPNESVVIPVCLGNTGDESSESQPVGTHMGIFLSPFVILKRKVHPSGIIIIQFENIAHFKGIVSFQFFSTVDAEISPVQKSYNFV